MPIDKTLSNLVINKIPTQEIYNKLKERNLINEDELYLVEEGGVEGAISIIKRTIEMSASSWIDNGDGTFSQPVMIDDGEVDCIVELQPNDDQILQLISDKTTSLRVDNDEGNFIAVATGAAPSVDLSIQATIIGIFEELPELDIIPISRGGTGATTTAQARANLGIAEVIPIEQGGTGATTIEEARANLGLDDVSGAKSYLVTIGTNWTTDSSTGVKYQQIAISDVLDKHKGYVDHSDTSHDGTTSGIALYTEEENQYLKFITNGCMRTYDGGLRVEIFGDAPTIQIPIVLVVF